MVGEGPMDMISIDSSGSESESSAVVNDSFEEGESGDIGPRDECRGGGVSRRLAFRVLPS